MFRRRRELTWPAGDRSCLQIELTVAQDVLTRRTGLEYMDSTTAWSRSRSSRADFGDSVRRDHGADVHQLDQRGGGRPGGDAGSAGGRARMQRGLGDRGCGVLPDVDRNRARTRTKDPASDSREPRSDVEQRLILDALPSPVVGGADTLGGRRASRTAGRNNPTRRSTRCGIAGTSPARSPSSCWCSSRRFRSRFRSCCFRGPALRCARRTPSPSRCCSGWDGRWARTPADRAGGPGWSWSASDWCSSRSRSRWADESADVKPDELRC